jgi:hypothetical protein
VHSGIISNQRFSCLVANLQVMIFIFGIGVYAREQSLRVDKQIKLSLTLFSQVRNKKKAQLLGKSI